MARRDQIKNAYALTGDHASFYDYMQSTTSIGDAAPHGRG